jgi:hypothetical protein
VEGQCDRDEKERNEVKSSVLHVPSVTTTALLPLPLPLPPPVQKFVAVEGENSRVVRGKLEWEEAGLVLVRFEPSRASYERLAAYDLVHGNEYLHNRCVIAGVPCSHS